MIVHDAVLHALHWTVLVVTVVSLPQTNLCFSNAIDEIRKAVDIQFPKLEEHLNRAVLDIRESINIVEKENNVLKDKCSTLEHRVEWIEKHTATHDYLVNTNERYLR